MIGIFSDEMFSDGTFSGGLFSDGQGWEFAHRFSERIARFLRKNERMSDSLKKQEIRSFAHFW